MRWHLGVRKWKVLSRKVLRATTSTKHLRKANFTSSISWSWTAKSSSSPNRTYYLIFFVAISSAVVKTDARSASLKPRDAARRSVEASRSWPATLTSSIWSSASRCTQWTSRYSTRPLRGSSCSISAETSSSQTMKVRIKTEKWWRIATGSIYCAMKTERISKRRSKRASSRWKVRNRNPSRNESCSVSRRRWSTSLRESWSRKWCNGSWRRAWNKNSRLKPPDRSAHLDLCHTLQPESPRWGKVTAATIPKTVPPSNSKSSSQSKCQFYKIAHRSPPLASRKMLSLHLDNKALSYLASKKRVRSLPEAWRGGVRKIEQLIKETTTHTLHLAYELDWGFTCDPGPLAGWRVRDPMIRPNLTMSSSLSVKIRTKNAKRWTRRGWIIHRETVGYQTLLSSNAF